VRAGAAPGCASQTRLPSVIVTPEWHALRMHEPEFAYKCRPALGLPTQCILLDFRYRPNLLILLGERAGARTQDPVIKSHVLYRLSYALSLCIWA
jgi:hypothetical protein